MGGEKGEVKKGRWKRGGGKGEVEKGRKWSRDEYDGQFRFN